MNALNTSGFRSLYESRKNSKPNVQRSDPKSSPVHDAQVVKVGDTFQQWSDKLGSIRLYKAS